MPIHGPSSSPQMVQLFPSLWLWKLKKKKSFASKSTQNSTPADQKFDNKKITRNVWLACKSRTWREQQSDYCSTRLMLHVESHQFSCSTKKIEHKDIVTKTLSQWEWYAIHRTTTSTFDSLIKHYVLKTKWEKLFNELKCPISPFLSFFFGGLMNEVAIAGVSHPIKTV